MSTRKIGPMPQGWDAKPAATDRLVSDEFCPKCGAEMEAIDMSPEGPPLEHLQLCPGCYLVMWTDEHGTQLRQGVPMKKDAIPSREPYPSLASGGATKC